MIATRKLTRTALTIRHMNGQTAAVTQFQLATPGGTAVDVHLRASGERWAAVAVFGGRREIAIAASARAALRAALEPLGDATRTALMADVALLGPSCEILEVTPAGA